MNNAGRISLGKTIKLKCRITNKPSNRRTVDLMDRVEYKNKFNFSTTLNELIDLYITKNARTHLIKGGNVKEIINKKSKYISDKLLERILMLNGKGSNTYKIKNGKIIDKKKAEIVEKKEEENTKYQELENEESKIFSSLDELNDKPLLLDNGPTVEFLKKLNEKFAF